MDIDEKKRYVMKLLMGIGLDTMKIYLVANELDEKSEIQIDEMICKLEEYYSNQNLFDKEFLKQLDKIDHKIDENIDATIDTFQVEHLNF